MTNVTSLNDQLAALVETIFHSLSIAGDHKLSAEDGTFVRSRVVLKGGFEGAIAIKCSRALAVELARRMFMAGDVAPSLDEAQDAVHEFANMIAGNIKGILGQTRMSLPSIPELGSSGEFPTLGELASVDVPVGHATLTVTVVDGAAHGAGR